MSRYYPGFLAAFFIVLLRIAIGWHFLYEGCEKVEVDRVTGKEPFSAEIYLRNATGPFGSYFRGMLPDVNSLAMLDPARLKASWKDDVSWIADHYGFTPEQRDKAQKILDESLQWADYWFDDPENVEKIREILSRPWSDAGDRARPGCTLVPERASWDARRSVDADRRSLIQPLVVQRKRCARRSPSSRRPTRSRRRARRGNAMFDWLDKSRPRFRARCGRSSGAPLCRSVGPVSTCSTR